MFQLIKNISLVTLLSLFTAIGFASSSIAVVNLTQVFQNVPQGATAFAQLQKKYAPQANLLQNQRIVFYKQVKAFEANQNKLSAAQQEAQLNQLWAQKQKLQKSMDDYSDHIRTDQQNLLRMFGSHLKAAVIQIAKAHDYHLVLSSQIAVYDDQVVNITPQVIRAMQ